ncbi:MAG: APC family permease [Thermoanaerobaculia bacterium]
MWPQSRRCGPGRPPATETRRFGRPGRISSSCTSSPRPAKKRSSAWTTCSSCRSRPGDSGDERAPPRARRVGTLDLREKLPEEILLRSHFAESSPAPRAACSRIRAGVRDPRRIPSRRGPCRARARARRPGRHAPHRRQRRRHRHLPRHQRHRTRGSARRLGPARLAGRRAAGALRRPDLRRARRHVPRAGGIYHYLKEAFGPLPGFLYGWTCFLIIMSGGIAAIAIGFGEYLGAFFPGISSAHLLASARIGGWTWTLSSAQLVGVAAILFLTAINHAGLKHGAGLQNLLTILKIGAIVGVGVCGFAVAARATIGITAPLPAASGSTTGGLLAGFGVAMIAALWTYDGWYGLTFSAGEMRDPGRTLPRGLIWGTLLITALYLLINAVYLRALPIDRIATESRIGEAAVAALFGATAGHWLAAAVAVSRIRLPRGDRSLQLADLSPDGRGRSLLPLAREDRSGAPRSAAGLWAQSLWAVLLTLSGTYSQLYTFCIFAGLLFHLAAGLTIFVLRRREPGRERPYRVWGYPWVPLAFLLATAILLVNTLLERPVESLAGLGLVALGLPAYWLLRRQRS